MKTLAQRFDGKTQPGPNGCLLWTGCVDAKGYGRIVVDGRRVGAHRVAWIVANGPITDDLLVCHTCDNPPCVRPDHLFLGTHKDNMDDAISKGRANNCTSGLYKKGQPLSPNLFKAIGETNGSARLTAAQVLDIREIGKQGRQTTALAEKYGVARATIWNILTRKTWQHIA